jgi:hypothetical protein
MAAAVGDSVVAVVGAASVVLDVVLEVVLDVVEAKAMQDQRKAGYFQKAASIPELRSNLSAITNEWGKVSGSMFNLPIQGKDGSTYTLAQKYGIK